MPRKSKLLTTTVGSQVPGPDLTRMRRPPTHPGEMLVEEFLKPAGVSQRQAALELGMSVNRMNEIVLAKRGVTAETAVLFGKLTGTSPELWARLQADYDVWHAMQKLKTVKVRRLVPGEPFPTSASR